MAASGSQPKYKEGDLGLVGGGAADGSAAVAAALSGLGEAFVALGKAILAIDVKKAAVPAEGKKKKVSERSRRRPPPARETQVLLRRHAPVADTCAVSPAGRARAAAPRFAAGPPEGRERGAVPEDDERREVKESACEWSPSA
jgi:hypothetical protein